MSPKTDDADTMAPVAVLRCPPQPLTRIGLLLLSLAAVACPVLSSDAFGLRLSIRIAHTATGSLANALPLAALVALAVATSPAARRYGRIADTALAAIAVVIGLVVLLAYCQGQHELDGLGALADGRRAAPVTLGFSYAAAALLATIVWSVLHLVRGDGSAMV